MHVILHSDSHPTLHIPEQAPQENPQVLEHDVQKDEHASEHFDVHEVPIQLNRQFASHAPADSVPQMERQAIPTQFLLHPC